MKKIGAVLLAAGAGKRFGGHKLETRVLGKPMYEYALELLAKQSHIDSVFVVTGSREVETAARRKNMEIVWNAQPELGISRSIKLGIDRMFEKVPELEGLMFMVCDQPWLKANSIDTMIREFHGGICALKCGERTGNPVIFSEKYFRELQNLTGDVGGRQVMRRHEEDVYYYEVYDSKELQDIDRREQLGQEQEEFIMSTIYFDQVSRVMPMAEGVEEAMAAASAMPSEEVRALVQDTRVQLNKLFHGPGAEGVVFTAGVEAALSQVIRSVLKKGDHILISPMESDTVMNTLNDMAGDVEYTMIPCNEKGQLILFDDEKGEKPFETIERLVRPNTKAIILNHASEVCGTVLEVKAVAEFARRKGMLMIANVAQTAAFVPIFMNIWGVDILTFSGGFGLLASEKIGGFVAGERAAELLGGPDMRSNFEQNPLDTAAVVGLHKAFDFIIEKRLYTLSSTAQKRADQFIRKVQHVAGVHIIGPGYNNRVPVVSIQTDFMDEAALVEVLKNDYGIVARAGYQGAEQAHKSLGTWPRGTVRFSFTYFNEESDIEEVTHALWQLTVHNDKDAHIQRMPKE